MTAMTFRAARREDADSVITLIYSSGPEVLRYIYGAAETAPLEWLAFCFKNGEGFFGFRNHIVAELDGLVVGVGAFYKGDEFKALNEATVKQIFRYFGYRKGLVVLFRAARYARKSLPPGKDAYIAANLGVKAEYRGLGVGSRMLEFAEKIARERGNNALVLDVAAPNHRAQDLYKRLGFRAVQEFRDPFKARGIEVPYNIRMELALTPVEAKMALTY
jgi:ribosomal protein S18 acetylase RimI-like enzyme